ncbi:MAG: AsmA family protein [Woeseiaceae bacterium]
MKRVVRKTLRVLLLTVALAFVVVLLGILPFRVGFLKGPIEAAVRDAVGLELSIRGPISVRLGPTPGVASGDLSLGAPAADPLLEVDSLQARISLLSLLRGRIQVRELSSDGIRIDYCARLPDFPEKPEEASEPPSIAVDGVELIRVSIRCGPHTQDDPLAVDIGLVTASAPLDTSMQLSAEGSVSALDFELSITGGELVELLADTKPFPVSASLTSIDALLEVRGHLQMPSGEPIAEAHFAVDVRDLQSLAGTFGIALPELDALDAQGHLRLDRESIDFSGLAGNLVNSDFAIDGSINFAGDRPHVTLTATSDQLDVEPLFVDQPEVQKPGSVTDDTDVDLDPVLAMLDTFDADIDVTVSEVLGLPLDVKSIELDAGIVDGRIELQSLGAELLGGSWSVDGELNSRAECPELKLIAKGNNLDFATINPMLALEQTLGGGANAVSLETSSCGGSLFAHRDTLRANATIAGVRASLGGNTLPVSVDKATFSVAPGERGRGRLIGTLMSERLEAALAVGSLEALLGTDLWPLDLDVRGGGGRLRVNGRARMLQEQLLVDARTRFNAPKFGTLHAWTGGAADASLPLNAETRLRLDESEMVANNIAISLGKSDVSGRAAWSYAKDPDLLAVTVRSKSVDIAEIITVLPPESERADSAPAQTPDDKTPRQLVLPPIDLDLEITAIHADRLDIQNLSVGARLRKGLIDEARVSLVVEDAVQLDGRLDLDARQLPARGQLEFSAENLDIGRVLRRLEVVDDLNLRADALELLVTMQGTTPRQFVLNTLLQADLLGFNWKIPKSNSGDETATEESFDVELEQVQLTAAPGEATTWTSRGRVDGVDSELFIRTPSLHDIFSDIAELPITLVAAADNDVAMIDARFDRTTEDRILARVMISGQVVASENRALSELASPLEDYQLQSDVILGENRLQLADVQMRLGTSSAQGYFDIDATGPRRKFDVSLHAPYLQTDDLLYWSPDVREAIASDGEPGEHNVDTGSEEIDTNDEPAERRGVLFLVNDFLAEFRENNDLGIRITVDELRAGSGLLGGGEIQLHVDETEFSLSPVTFSLPGGGVDAEYRTSVRDGRLDAGLSVRADALSYGGLLRLADHTSEAQGLLYLDADIGANVILPPGAVPINLLFENAQGEISFAAWPQNFEAGVLDLWSANVIFAVLPTPDTGETSKLNCLVTRFDITDGVMESRTTLLDTTDTVIRGRGTIDLKNEQLDLLAWPQAKREKFFSVSTPVAVTGSFDDFQIGVEPGGFVGTMIKWYTALIYVPFKWLTGERFEPDGTSTCFDAMDWELTPELQEYFLKRDFSTPPEVE